MSESTEIKLLEESSLAKASFGAVATFGAAKKPEEEEEAGDANPEAEVAAEFKPIFHASEVAEVTGEEAEEVFHKERCKLYRFAADMKEWKERGTGDVKMLKHKETGRTRLLMRQEKTLKIVMNHVVHPDIKLTPNAGNDKSWVWTVDDFADNEIKTETFAIRFKTAEIANSFKEKYDAARDANAALLK